MRPSSRTRAALGLLAVVAALAIAACDKQSACRPGTLFLRVDLGPYTTGVNELDVGVSVDGGIAMHTSLAVTPGMNSGGIEVQFPHGYPAGKPVTIQVAVKAGGVEIANRTMTVTPASGCDVIDTTFTGADAVTGAGGAGGAGGTGGEAGTLGGGAGTRATAGTGGVGRGGATGGSIGGSFAGGRGGSMGRGGTGGACVPVGAENCFNNYDDDCDGDVDCEDLDCAPIGQCAPLRSAGVTGIVVPSTTPCPSGYYEFAALMNGPSAGGCTGCSCRPPTVTCTTTIYSFGSANACSTATIAGVQELMFSSTQTCTVPSWVGSTQGTIYGVQAGQFMASVSNGCTPSGTPTLAPITWSTTSRFCAASLVGGGCGGQACVPIVAASQCVLFEGAQSCPPNTGVSYWYTGATDGRSCGACRCDQVNGASCSGMAVSVGSDFSCSTVTQTVGQGQRKCYGAAGVNSPGLVFTGTPSSPTCPASSTVSGAITPNGMKTVCCTL